MSIDIVITGIERIQQPKSIYHKKYLRSPKYQNPIYVFTGAPTTQPDIRQGQIKVGFSAELKENSQTTSALHLLGKPQAPDNKLNPAS